MATVPSNPFEPGTSPFHAKGTIWIGVRDFVNEHVPGAYESLDRKLEPPFKEFLAQKFVPAGWYDLLPIAQIARAIAAAMKVDGRQYARLTAEWQASRDLAGAYAPVLSSDAPENICRRFAGIYGLIYDFGRAEVVSEEPKRVLACAHGMPELIAPWWMNATQSYLETVLRAAGARNPRLLWKPPVSDGERHGIRLVRIESSTEWD